VEYHSHRVEATSQETHLHYRVRQRLI
jgi:hypothetical protein